MPLLKIIKTAMGNSIKRTGLEFIQFTHRMKWIKIKIITNLNTLTVIASLVDGSGDTVN